MAELMATTRSFWPIRYGSLVMLTGNMLTAGLSSTKSYRRRVPMRKVAAILSRLIALLRLVITPSLYRSTTPSLNISLWMPRSFFSCRKSSTASGMPPMPSCRQEPSSTRPAMCLPMASSTGPIRGGCSSMMSCSLSTMRSISETWMNESPWVRGILGLTWATTVFATWAAGLV